MRCEVRGPEFIVKGFRFIVKGLKLMVKGFKFTAPRHNIRTSQVKSLGFRVIISTNVVRREESLACIYVV